MGTMKSMAMPFEEGDIFTTTGVYGEADRLNFRYQTMFDGIGGLLAGKTVLEFGSHNGRWTHICLQLGAEKVIGLDHNDKYVALATRILCERYSPDRFEFHHVDCTRFEDFVDEVNIVLCMGVLYYLDDPLGFLDKIAGLTPQLCVLDTFHTWNSVPAEEVLDQFLDQRFWMTKLAKYDNGRRISYHLRPRQIVSL